MYFNLAQIFTWKDRKESFSPTLYIWCGTVQRVNFVGEYFHVFVAMHENSSQAFTCMLH